MRNILVVDDEAGIRNALSDILSDEGYRVLSAEDGIEGLEKIRANDVDLVLLDVWLPRRGGMDVLEDIKRDYPSIEVVVISGHGNIDMAVRAVKLGAFDFLEKPLSLDKVITVCRNALAMRDLKRENSKLKIDLDARDDMVGNSAPMAKIRQIIEQSAASDARVLILGENGTGKELVAREIHRRSTRARGPFVETNCAAIPDNLIESELFGHERGAFTDAVSRRRGKFELAHGGTLFMDEVADMSLSAQAKVLRVLQEMSFERVGAEESIKVDVRVIAATNKDIKEEIAAGRFREDLFFRLNVIPIQMPALRERKDDIPLLAAYFLERYSDERGLPGRRFSPAAIDALLAHDWPGNVRELKNLVERISVMSDEEEIGPDTVAAHMDRRVLAECEEPLPGDFSAMKLGEARDLFERSYLVQKLKENGYNISRTAEAIGVYPSNLHAKIRKYGIRLDK